MLHLFINDLVIALPKYNLPVSKMGDFQSFLINQKVLRPVEEDNSLQKANIFGSPYRLKVFFFLFNFLSIPKSIFLPTFLIS